MTFDEWAYNLEMRSTGREAQPDKPLSVPPEAYMSAADKAFLGACGISTALPTDGNHTDLAG